MGQNFAQFNMVASSCMFNNSKILFRAEQYQTQDMHMGSFRNYCLLFPASFKLAQIGSFIMFHLLPCLTTFNIVGYKTERELINRCGVPSICNLLHIELHLICSIVCCTLPCHTLFNRTCIILVCASCHVHACAFTMLFVCFRCCFFSVIR